MSPLKIALIAQGHDVTVFTNYPPRAAERFGLPMERVRSFVLHGVSDRVSMQVARRTSARYPEQWLHEWFGRWAAREVGTEEWDVIHCWSGVSEELLAAFRGRRAVTLLMRGSSHIRVQDALLREEESRSGQALDRPSRWMIERETREYALADHVLVLSSFARRTFLDEGEPAERVSMLPLGVDVSSFRITPAERDARVERILGSGPVRVLYVGAWSLRKGMMDLVHAARTLREEPFEFRLVGPAMAETSALLAGAPSSVKLMGKRPQHQLAADYAAADVFLFPTIEDGFGMVLTQAMAAGLPCVTTPNGAGPDFIDEGRNGWIVPIRQPDAIAERLRWFQANRGAMATMVKKLDGAGLTRDWSDVGRDFAAIGRELLAKKSSPRSQVATFRPRARKSELPVHGD